MTNIIDILKIAFPALMVIGALGSLILNICIMFKFYTDIFLLYNVI